jgi:hypothetical protein
MIDMVLYNIDLVLMMYLWLLLRLFNQVQSLEQSQINATNEIPSHMNKAKSTAKSGCKSI